MTDWLADAAAYAGRWLEHQVRVFEQPGCTFAIARHGAIVAEGAFGVADAATAAPLTVGHRFRVASHSKTFTAAGIMLLREAGRLRLDDPVATHVAGLTPAVGALTIAQLLSHSAGVVRDGLDAGHWQDRRPFLDEADLRAQLAEPPTLPAGSTFKYSNIGFGLLGLVIAAVTGEPYVDWIARAVVEPSGLAETTPDVSAEALARLATGHSARLPLGHRVTVAGRNPTHALASATGFVSTARDLARFVDSLDPGAGTSILSPVSRREMTRRHWAVPHARPARHYGLGTIGGVSHGQTYFGHSGGFQGFITRTSCVPAWGVTVSVLTHAADGLANQWVDGILAIMHAFSRHGAPQAEVGGWAGRWWTLWGVADLVPMGSKVLVALPGQLDPFAEASEIEVSSPTEGRIALANGFGSAGEPVRRTRGPDGGDRLWLGGAELLPEAALAAELRGWG